MPLVPVRPARWYNLVVVQAPGQITAYVNGKKVYTGPIVAFGEPTTEIVLGASTSLGPSQYSQFFKGALAQFGLRSGSMSAQEVATAYKTNANELNILVKVGFNDPRVNYWEGTKWLAKIRSMKTDHNMDILKVNMGAGHGGASGRYDALKDTAFDYGWMLRQWGVSP